MPLFQRCDAGSTVARIAALKLSLKTLMSARI